MTDREQIRHAARKGVLSGWQLAYFWALSYWCEHGETPKGAAIPAGVRAEYGGKRISPAQGYEGLRMLKATLPK